jgi:hypothetical protein
MQAGYYQPAPGYGWDGAYQPGYDQGLPPVSAMLMREAEAWRALLNLHTGVMGTARQMANTLNESDPSLETSLEVIETREAGYYATLSQLASHCDALSTEALRLRALRKSRAQTDTQALQALMQAHSSETLGIGTMLAGQSSTQINTVTSELRQATQSTRQQIAQTRALLQVLQDAPSLRGRVTLRVDDAHSFTPDEIVQAVYRTSSDLTDDALCQALADLCKSDSHTTAAPAERAAQTARVRRASDRGAAR